MWYHFDTLFVNIHCDKETFKHFGHDVLERSGYTRIPLRHHLIKHIVDSLCRRSFIERVLHSVLLGCLIENVFVRQIRLELNEFTRTTLLSAMIASLIRCSV